jgi:hypothetical protein
MAKDRILVEIQSKVGEEEAYFREQDQKRIKNLRETAAQEATVKYCEEHKNHCFRCGTKSLVEVNRGDLKIDICVNENCGAVHLDPGELEQILKDEKIISVIRKSVFAVFIK